MTISNLRDSCIYDMTYAPDFVNLSRPTDREVWDMGQCIFAEIYKLLVNKVLSNIRIQIYMDNITLYLDCMFNMNIKSNIAFEMKNYISDKILEYLEDSVESELFESAANIKSLLSKWQ